MRSIGAALCLVSLSLLGGPSPTQAAYTPFYSNTTNFLGYGYAGGGAATFDGALSTTMVADDITPAAGYAGSAVNSISFSVTNFNAAAVSASALLLIYDSSNGGGPGNLLAAIEFTPISFTGGGATGLYTYTTTSTIFTLPTTTFWAGISFNNLDGSTATATQLNSLGQGLFDPPTVGSSNNYFFKSTSPSSLLSTNPAGGLSYFGGSPVANFGFSFSGTPLVSVPEPSSVVLLGIAGMILAFGRRVIGKAQASGSTE